MRRLIIILSLISLTASAQERIITKDYIISDSEIISRMLHNLENEANDIIYRIWIEPDLIIEVGNNVILTLYITNYDKKKKQSFIDNVENIRLDINPKLLLNHFDSLKLDKCRDAKSRIDNKAVSVIHDGHRILIEFSSKEEYKVFSLYGPLTDKSQNSRKTLDLLNFISDSINPDMHRIEYYQRLSGTNKKAKRRLRDIIEYKDFFKKQINENIFPKMWGDF